MPRRVNLSLVSDTDWARLAAFIDGEGCVSIKANSSRRERLRVHVANTDPRLGQWLLVTFGGRIDCHRASLRNPRWKDRFDWVVYSQDAAALLQKCRPYLLLKGDQADVALAFQATVGHRGGRKGVSRSGFVDSAVYAQRVALHANLRLLNKKGA